MAIELEKPDVAIPVAGSTPLKAMVVNYIGEKINPEDGNVTVDMAVEIFAPEFPEFLMAVAEENFLRGYEQALSDLANTEGGITMNKPPEKGKKDKKDK